MFNYPNAAALSDGIDRIEKRLVELEKNKPTLSVPVVDEDGEYVRDYRYLVSVPKQKYITIREAFDALEEMCGVEITYQEIKGTSKVVIYDKD